MAGCQAGWSGIILAGGEGSRLRPLSRIIAGDERPKQFCKLLGHETLLEQTRQRARLLIEPERLLTVVTRSHERFYAPALAEVAPQTVVVQPEGRGTAPAILYALHRLEAVARNLPTVLLPSDHHYSDDNAFMARVEGALEAVEARPDLVVLLGIEPDREETEYGWIDPAEIILGPWAWPLYRVSRFWEKPAAPLAKRLRARGSLWNSFVIVGWCSVLQELIRRATPELSLAFAPLRTRIGTPWEAELARRVYARLPSFDFSRHVLESTPPGLAVLPVSGLSWNDLGDPARVIATRRSLERQRATA